MKACIKNGMLIRLAVAALLLAIVPLGHAQTIKLATLAPEGSAWTA